MLECEVDLKIMKNLFKKIEDYLLKSFKMDEQEFVLKVVQPGLSGLMDGSVSTLAPIFATIFATHTPFTAFLIGMASAAGAGISMAFSEALSDDGVLTGRGNPVKRGIITGGMTFIGGFGHTLPFLLSDYKASLIVAYIVVAVELILISAIRKRYFKTSWAKSIFQVVGGGVLVLYYSFPFRKRLSSIRLPAYWIKTIFFQIFICFAKWF